MAMTEERLDELADECEMPLAHDSMGKVDIVATLVALLRAPSHYRHEDVARYLQELRDPRAIEALFETAHVNHAYLEHSPGVLARKCTWALADIGTPEAYERLRTLAAGSDARVAAYAQKRIDAWSEEADRKGPRPPR
jgi:hypothetical protein